MPSFTPEEIAQLGYIALDHYLKNKPIDQIGRERPLLSKLMAGKKSFPGGKEYVVEQVRKSYDSNFGWYFGDDTVDYNRKDTVRQARYEWQGAHDGFSLNEDLLFANGITLTDRAGPSSNAGADALQLTNLFEENIETLRLGFEEQFDLELHMDGTQDAKSVAGLDHLIALDPTAGVVGGLDRSTEVWWRNQAQAGTGQSTMIEDMEKLWRACTLNGGKPDFIMAGAEFIDTFRAAAKDEISRYTILQTEGQNAQMDPSISAEATRTGLHFQGVPIVWDPTFEVLDEGAPAVPWTGRCYMINTKHMKLRPAAGHDMIARKPPRNADAYIFFWGLTWKGALTMNRSNAHAVISLDSIPAP